MFGFLPRFRSAFRAPDWLASPVVESADDGPAGVDSDEAMHWLSIDDEWPGMVVSVYFTTRRKWATMRYSDYVVLPVGKLFVIALFIHRRATPRGRSVERLPRSTTQAP